MSKRDEYEKYSWWRMTNKKRDGYNVITPIGWVYFSVALVACAYYAYIVLSASSAIDQGVGPGDSYCDVHHC